MRFSDYIFFVFIFIQLQSVYSLRSESSGAILKTLMRPETEDNALNLFQNDKKKYKFIRIFMYRESDNFLITTARILFRNIMRRTFTCQPLSRKMAFVGAFESCLFKDEFR